MILVPSIHIPRLATSNGSAILTASNVAIESIEWNSISTYSINTERRVTDDGVYRLYKSKQDSNNNNYPPTSPTWWTDLGPINRFRMFSQNPNDTYATYPNTEQRTTTSGSTDITCTLRPGQSVSAAVFMNLRGVGVQVQVYDLDNASSLEYDTTKTLLSGGVQKIFDLAFTDLPTAVTNPQIDIIIDAPASGGAACGLCVIGTGVDLGATMIGASAGIRDYSTKTVNAEGLVSLAQGRFTRAIEADVWIDAAADVPVVHRRLTDYRATPVAWVGDPDRGETIVYGYYRDFSVTIPSAIHAICSLEIDGI